MRVAACALCNQHNADKTHKAKDPVFSLYARTDLKEIPLPLEYGTGSYVFIARSFNKAIELFVYTFRPRFYLIQKRSANRVLNDNFTSIPRIMREAFWPISK